MKRLQAFKFELRANGGQQRRMRRFAGCCRFVYNKALAWQIAAYAKDRTVKFNYTKLANFLPTWKQEMPPRRSRNPPKRLRAMPRSSVGISVVHGGEDVNGASC
jgi:putative transposase